jgi:hypothetical protein
MIQTIHYIAATCGAFVLEPCRNFKLAVFKHKQIAYLHLL